MIRGLFALIGQGQLLDIAKTRAAEAFVEVLQMLLRAVNAYGGKIDGEAGPYTQEALRDWKAANDLPADTILDQETNEKLTEAALDRTPEFAAGLPEDKK